MLITEKSKKKKCRSGIVKNLVGNEDVENEGLVYVDTGRQIYYLTEMDEVIEKAISIGADAEVVEAMQIIRQKCNDDYFFDLDKMDAGLKQINKIHKGVQLKNKYYKNFSACIKEIFRTLDEIESYRDEDYTEYVASVKAELSKDYAENFPYYFMSEREVIEMLDNITDLQMEAHEVLDELKKIIRLKKNEDIGKATLDIFEIDSIDDLDNVLYKKRQEDSQRREGKNQAIEAALHAMHGDKATLAEVFKKNT